MLLPVQYGIWYTVRMRHIAFFVCAALAAIQVPAAFSPAGTVTFTDLQVIAAQVASIGSGTSDPLLTQTLPQKIRRQGAAQLFGPMRRGMPGVAVCYVDAQLIAKLTASRKASRNSSWSSHFLSMD